MIRIDRLIAALIISVAAFVSAEAASAEPALWVVHGGSGATAYLFGTVHARKGDSAWQSSKIDTALEKSKELWAEVADGDDGAKLQPLVMRLGIDSAHPLSGKVLASDLAKLDAAAKSLGMPGEQALEPMQPWLAALTLFSSAVVKAGYDPNSGIDRVIKADAISAGKPVIGFETAEQQLHYFADMSPALQVQFLESALDNGGTPSRLNEVVKAWEAGDVETIDRLENEDLTVKRPGLYKLLIVDRNERFAEQIARRLQAGGTFFVAIGAGHLAGRDSVQSLLRKRGLQVDRQ